jgi:hypothetical protein
VHHSPYIYTQGSYMRESQLRTPSPQKPVFTGLRGPCIRFSARSDQPRADRTVDGGDAHSFLRACGSETSWQMTSSRDATPIDTGLASDELYRIWEPGGAFSADRSYLKLGCSCAVATTHRVCCLKSFGMTEEAFSAQPCVRPRLRA